MNPRNGKRIIAALIVIVTIAALSPTAHAQPNISTSYDRASYIPGDSGTLTVSVVNNDPTSTLEIRNITVYFPWAKYVNGAWPSGANTSQNLSPWPQLGSAQSGNNIKTYQYSFTVPSWYAGSIGGSFSNCASDPAGPRFSTSNVGCILVGYTASPPRYMLQEFSIAMALPTYTPVSLIFSEWIPIATLVVLVIATALLAMIWSTSRRTMKKQ